MVCCSTDSEVFQWVHNFYEILAMHTFALQQIVLSNTLHSRREIASYHFPGNKIELHSRLGFFDLHLNKVSICRLTIALCPATLFAIYLS